MPIPFLNMETFKRSWKICEFRWDFRCRCCGAGFPYLARTEEQAIPIQVVSIIGKNGALWKSWAIWEKLSENTYSENEKETKCWTGHDHFMMHGAPRINCFTAVALIWNKSRSGPHEREAQKPHESEHWIEKTENSRKWKPHLIHHSWYFYVIFRS